MNLYVVRADFGKYTDLFIKGGYVAIGWLHTIDLSNITERDELYPLYRKYHPEDTSNVVIGQQVGQIARFLLEIQPGDYVITPDANTDYVYYGVVQPGNSYYLADSSDGCPFTHRRKVKWNTVPILRNQFSVPFQNTIRSSLTVFRVNHLKDFLETIGKSELLPENERSVKYDYYTSVLNQILALEAKEFEILISNLLTALGFEGSRHTGKVGDGGVDVTGELNVYGMAKIKLYVQAKRYQLGAKISAGTVKALRQSIPYNGQGAFITTADYQKAAEEVAVDPNFPRIGLINGKQLVDLLADYWEDVWDQLPQELKDKLNFKLGLVLS